MTQEPKRHHYIPEFFLRRWCQNGKLIRYCRTRKGVWSGSFAPTAVAFRTDLYKLRGRTVENPQGLETKFFGKLDNDASLVIDKLLTQQGATTTRAEQESLILFMLGLPARTPWSINVGEEIARTTHTAELNRDPEEAIAAGMPADEKLFDFHLKRNPHFLHDSTRRILIDVMTDPRIVRRLLDWDWWIKDVRESSVDLVLGDNALIRSGDLDGDRCILALPLSPSKLVFATNISHVQANMTGDATRLVNLINLDSVSMAKEHVFATGRHHLELAEKYLCPNP